MKLKVLLWLIISIIPLHLSAQNLEKDIVKAFEVGKAEILLPHLSEEVAVSIIDQKLKTNKEEAIKKIAQFLESIQIVSFKMKHTSTREESGYMIGSLQTTQTRYRINCFYKKETNIFYIHQIRIDKTNE